MVAGHVYSNPAMLPESWKREKRAVMQAHGARFGSAAFVTGGLDRLQGRADFLHLARCAGEPLLVACGGETPPKSRAEMDALAALPGVQSFVAPQGKLGFHEEFPDHLLPALTAFLS